MSRHAAKEGDKVVGIDTHVVLVPGPGGAIPTPMPMAFEGVLVAELCRTVTVDDASAATLGSKARNVPLHVPSGGAFQRPPSNEATVREGSASVWIEDKPAARSGDAAISCNDPADAETCTVVGDGTVFIGD